MTSPHTFLDLFCGCGGFSLGLIPAEFQGLAAIDFNPEAIQIIKANLPDVPQVLARDPTRFSPNDLEAVIGTNQVDLIVGGPPCQVFSTVRQVDGANHGERLKDNPRRHLYKAFLRHVEHFKPKVFVMENVLGLRSASGGLYFSKVQAEARNIWYRVHAQIEDCVNLGVPQKRRRPFFIGTQMDLSACFRPKLLLPKTTIPNARQWQAIGDLPPLNAGQGNEVREHDNQCRIKIITERSSDYLFKVLEVKKMQSLTAYRASPHSDRDLRDFARLNGSENSAEAIRHGDKFEFTRDTSTFKDRYTRQHRQRPRSTIVAQFSKNGLIFIYPTRNRSITPCEAARIQSFPDWFLFPVARTHQFHMIGSAVPPLVSNAIGNTIPKYLPALEAPTKRSFINLIPLPESDVEAAKWIVKVAPLSVRQIRQVPLEDLKRAWYSVSFLYIGLHPDSTADHGTATLNDSEVRQEIHAIEPRLPNPYYERSGWPVYLETLADEAWRRYGLGQFADDEFYCAEAQTACAGFRDREIAKVIVKSRELCA
jgi:DNA (cytosine-5)-methyltransferase 1